MPAPVKKISSVESVESCGMFMYRPKYLQVFNSMKSFMAFFTALLIVYGMATSYMSSVLPSIEKRFGFSSKYMGIILSVMDAGIGVTSLLTAHFAGHGHRPRGLFLGSCLCGFSLLLISAPEAFFPINAESMLGRIIETDSKPQLCTVTAVNNTFLQQQQANNATVCALEEDRNIAAMIVFAVSMFFLGVGSTTLMILGLPFIDDNCTLDDAPIYFAISFFGRIFGPMLGFGLGAVCNNVFLDGSKPNFKQTDPRWISAWYLGFLAIGGAVLIFAIMIGFFPSKISNGQEEETDDNNAETKQAEAEASETSSAQDAACDSSVSSREFFTNLRRLCVNLPFMCRVFSSCLDGMIITGFLSFFFKFIAQQYQISQSVATLSGGVPTILGIALGVIGGGLIIKKWHLQPRHVGIMLVTSAVLLCIVFLINITLGCARTEVVGLPGSESLHKLYEGYTVSFNGSYCSTSQKCGCSESEFRPVCDQKLGVNFFSACHAGCSQTSMINDTEYYDNCTCIENAIYYTDVNNDSKNGRMRGGFCSKNCPNVYVFVCVIFIAMFFMGLPLSGSIMVQYRLVDPDLKAMSTGLLLLITSMLGYLPAPIFVGAIVDSTCRLWQTSPCGERKFCLLYDTDEFRWRFLITAACIKAVGAVLDAIVTFKMWNMQFHHSSSNELHTSPTSDTTLSVSPSFTTSLRITSGPCKLDGSVIREDFMDAGKSERFPEFKNPYFHEISESRL